MFKHVIAGFDGYDGGRDAIALAAALEPEALTVLMTYGPEAVMARAGAVDYWEQQRDEARRRLATACMELGVEARERVAADLQPAHALQAVAVDERADLIVVGSSHRGPLGRLLAGDVGSAILRDSPCPVAIAPKRLHGHGWVPRRIGVAYDGSDESLAALELGRALAAQCDARLVVLTAWEMPAIDAAAYAPEVQRMLAEAEEQAQRLLDGALATLPAGTEGVLERGRPAHVLAEASGGLDLLLTGSRGWGTAGRLILGSTAHHLAHHAACPLIVLPRPVQTGDDARADGASSTPAAR